MRKKYCKPVYILCAALLFSTPAFADGPDLDDTEIVSSGPGMMIGSKEQEEAFSGNVSTETVPLLQDYGFSDYRVYGYNEMYDDLMALQKNYPSMHLDSLGKTIDGRELYHVIVGNPSAPKKILVHGSIHSREYIVTKVVMREIASLLEMEKKESGYQGNSIKHLLQNTCIHFVPMLNPDGVSLVQNGLNGIGSEELRKSVLEMAQKEHATHLSSYFRLWKNNLRGVNLNKNFDVNWEQTVDKKGYPSKDEYKGSSPESEVESKALADLQRKENFSATISYHTQGEVIYWYFGEGSYVEEAKKLAEIIKKNSNYRMVNSYHENYAGGFKDYMERKFNVPSVTVECGSGTSPVSEEQIDKIWAGQRGVLPDLLLEYKDS